MSTFYLTLILLAVAAAGYGFFRFIQLMDAGIKFFNTWSKIKEDESRAFKDHLKEKSTFHRRHIEALEITLADRLAGN